MPGNNNGARGGAGRGFNHRNGGQRQGNGAGQAPGGGRGRGNGGDAANANDAQQPRANGGGRPPNANRGGAAQAAPDARVYVPPLIATRLEACEDYRTQESCPICMKDLEELSFNRDTPPRVPSFPGRGSHHNIWVNPCGHWHCCMCHDRMLTAPRLGLEGQLEELKLEHCVMCRGGTGHVCNITMEQRDALYAMQAASAHAPVNIFTLTATRAAAARIGVQMAPHNASDNALQRMRNAVIDGQVDPENPNSVEEQAHRILAIYKRPMSSISCLGVLPAMTALRGAGKDQAGIQLSYHLDGGYVNLVDGGHNAHAVMHLQSRAITKYVVEIISALSGGAGPTRDRVMLVDVGGRPDVFQTLAPGGTLTLGANVKHMCPIIMPEDGDREALHEKWITGVHAGHACRCRLGEPKPAAEGYSKSGCKTCNPDDGTRRVFFLNHVYELSVEQLCCLAQTGDVLLSMHSFRGFNGKFAFKRGAADETVEAEWERMGDRVTMKVNGGYDYEHSSHNFLHQNRAMDCGVYGCFKWSRILSVGDLSLHADPMMPSKMSTTLWHLSKCDQSQVPLVRSDNFARLNATRTIALAGTTYTFTRDDKAIQIIAEGELNDSHTFSWECFDMVARNFVGQSPNTATTYARSRAVVMPHIPADKTNLVLCAARAFMRPGLVAYSSTIAADRVIAERIDAQLRGTPLDSPRVGVVLGGLIGVSFTRGPVGLLVGGALGMWLHGEVRDLRSEGLRVYMQRNNISPTHAMLFGAVCSTCVHGSVQLALRDFTTLASTIRMPQFTPTAAAIPAEIVHVADTLRGGLTFADVWGVGATPSIRQNPIVISPHFGVISASLTDIVDHACAMARSCGERVILGCSRMTTIDLTPHASVSRCRAELVAQLQNVTGNDKKTLLEWMRSSVVRINEATGVTALVNTTGIRQYAFVAVVFGCLTVYAIRRRPRRHRRVNHGSWLPGSIMMSDIMKPANLRPFTRGDWIRRLLFCGWRLALMPICPDQAQVLLGMFVSLDIQESRWLAYNIAHVTLEELLKAGMQTLYLWLAVRHGFQPVLNMHCCFAAYEFMEKMVVYYRGERTGVCCAVGGSMMAVGLHTAIRDLPFHKREALHTCWNLLTAWVSVNRGLVAARSNVGRLIHDIGGGVYDRLAFGNLIGGQAFLYDFDYKPPPMRDDAKIYEPSPYRYVAPKAKAMMVVGPLICTSQRKHPAPVAFTKANEYRALFRVVMTTIPFDAAYFREVFEPFAMKAAKSIFRDVRVWPMERADWLATMPPNRRSMLVKAYQDIDADPWLLEYHGIGGKIRDPTRRSMFLKIEQTEYDKDPRAIQAGLDTSLACAGPWCMSLCKTLRDVGDGETSYMGVDIIFGIGRDTTKCYRKFFQLGHQRRLIAMVTGDDVAACDGRRFYSIDAKRWDAHTGAELLELGNKVWRTLGMSRRILNLMQQGLKRNGRTVFGYAYSRIGGTASGDPDTIQKNCFLGLMLMLLALVEYAKAGGVGNFADTIKLIASRLGIVYEFVDEAGVAIGDHANYHRLEFCSRFPVVLVDGDWGASPKIGKVLYRFGLARTGQLPEVALRSKALSLLAEARHSSVLTHYALCAYDCVGAGRYVLEERRFTEYTTTLDIDVDEFEENEMLQARYGYSRDVIIEAISKIWDGFMAGHVVFNDPVIARLIEVDN